MRKKGKNNEKSEKKLMKSKSEITSKPKELLQKPHENCDFFVNIIVSDIKI